MGYLNRAWMAASVAVVQGHPDQGQKYWKPGLIKSLQHGRRRAFSAPASSDVRPLAAATAAVGALPAVEELGSQRDESFRQVMYLSCWGQG